KYPVTNKRYRRFIDFLKGEEEVALRQFAESLRAKAKKDEDFKKYLSKNPKDWAGLMRSENDDDKRFNGEDQPVVGVTWFAAMAYAHWLNELQRSTSHNQQSTRVFKLPTEMEWEWAASGGARIYPWGKDDPDDKRANYGSNVGQTTPVGNYPSGATPEGLMDMAGNVWEWCENLYGEGAYTPEARALRGGSWDYTTDDLPCAARDYNHPDSQWNVLGFRLVAAGQSLF
ncbi:MAG: formylglycine-generating enzyme family protein, partial [candidate division KSB1 bacterium]